MPGAVTPPAICPHCGLIHATTCPRIKRIEYAEDGVTVRALEFHAPTPAISSSDLRWSTERELWGPGSGPISNE